MDLTLFDRYHIAWASNPDEFHAFVNEHFPQVFALHDRVKLGAMLSEEEKIHFRNLQAQFGNPGEVLLYLMNGEERVGWFIGGQETIDTFYMRNTGILPAHQGKGVYKAFLPCLLAHVQALGYQKVSSRHIATHNGILIPKLQAGFVITGMELNELYGWLVHLTYYFNAERRALLMKRAGRG
jgi:hypothetical protein